MDQRHGTQAGRAVGRQLIQGQHGQAARPRCQPGISCGLRSPTQALLHRPRRRVCGCDRIRRWQLDGISRPKPQIGERATSQCLQRALVCGPRTGDLAVFPPGNQSSVASQMRLTKSPSGSDEGGRELLAALSSLGFADMAKDEIRCLTSILGPHRRFPSGCHHAAVVKLCLPSLCPRYRHRFAGWIESLLGMWRRAGGEIVIEFVAFALGRNGVAAHPPGAAARRQRVGGRVSQTVQPQGARTAAMSAGINAADAVPGNEARARLALVDQEINLLLARLADLRAVRLRQLADAQAKLPVDAGHAGRAPLNQSPGVPGHLPQRGEAGPLRHEGSRTSIPVASPMPPRARPVSGVADAADWCCSAAHGPS